MNTDKSDKVGLKDRSEFLEYKEWMKIKYPMLSPGTLHPTLVKEFKKDNQK